MAHHTEANGVIVSDDRTLLDLRRVHGWIAGSYWAAGIPFGVFVRSVQNSLCLGAYRQGEQVGFARVITDRATFAWLCDVWVDEAARGSGLGRAIVQAALDHPDLQGLRRWGLATKDAHSLYEGFGFGPVDAERGMEKVDREVYIRLTSES